MYASVRYPQVTNREDLIIPLEILDDDTGQPLNLSGTTGSGTFSSWTVTAGAAITSSSTTITIPAFPIGNQLSALALTVGTGLTINAGDPISISDSTGKKTMAGYVLSYNSTTGALTAQIGITCQFEIRRGEPHNQGVGFTPWFDIGTQFDAGPLLSASLGNGVLITDVGFLQIRIPESQFKKLTPGTHIAALTISDSVDTRQIFLASLPVLYGAVTI